MARGAGRTGIAGPCVLVAVAATIAVAGCSSVRQTMSGWFGATPSPTPAAVVAGPAETFYAAVDGLGVRAEPSASAKVLGRLALYERVSRTRLERGYAYVATDGNRLVGWVDNAQLLWRLPAAAAAPPANVEPAPGGGAAPGPPATGGAEAVNAAGAPSPPPTPTSTPAAQVAPPTAPAAPPTAQAAAPVPRGKPHAEPSVFDPF